MTRIEYSYTTGRFHLWHRSSRGRWLDQGGVRWIMQTFITLDEMPERFRSKAARLVQHALNDHGRVQA